MSAFMSEGKGETECKVKLNGECKQRSKRKGCDGAPE